MQFKRRTKYGVYRGCSQVLPGRRLSRPLSLFSHSLSLVFLTVGGLRGYTTVLISFITGTNERKKKDCSTTVIAKSETVGSILLPQLCSIYSDLILLHPNLCCLHQYCLILFQWNLIFMPNQTKLFSSLRMLNSLWSSKLSQRIAA